MNSYFNLTTLYPPQLQEDWVHSSGLKGYIEVMQKNGTDPFPLLEKYHFSPSQLLGGNTWLPHAAMIQLLEESALCADQADLGLQIAHYQDIGILGVLGSILQSATTLKEVIEYSSNLLYLHGSGVRLYIHQPCQDDQDNPDSDMVQVIFDIQLRNSNSVVSKRQSMDLGLAVCHRVLNYLSHGRYHPVKITLPHTPLCSINVYKRFFQSEVLINQQHAALYINKEMLHIPIASINHGLRDMVENYLQQRSGLHSKHMRERVRQILAIHLSGPQANKTDIARLLALHPRSLQRKLKQEGTHFDEIKDQLRRQLLLQYLADSHISIGQIAFKLGFSEQSSLSRACKTWFGLTPKQLKALYASNPRTHTHSR